MNPKEVVNIQSGEMRVSTSGSMAIVLGSCVSIIIYDRVLRMGGANHFLLPDRSHAGDQSDLSALHFGDESILLLLKEFKSRGSHRENLLVKLVGGAGPLGRLNIEIAERTLAKYKLSIENKSVGGEHGRKVQFDPASGEVLCKLLPSYDTLVEAPIAKIKVLIVDDSKAIRMILKKIFSSDSSFEIVGEAANPVAAEIIRIDKRPDIITLDIQMPVQDGVSYLKSIPKPFQFQAIIITDFSMDQGGPVVAAMEAGAFHYFQKPSLTEISDLGHKIREISRLAYDSYRKRLVSVKRKGFQSQPKKLKRPSLIVIGSSTGGTEVVKEILAQLPVDCPPVLVVQHMPEFFTKAFAARLNELSQIEIREAVHGDKVESGLALIAPGGKQMSCVARNGEWFIKVTDDPPLNRFKPSVDFLFNSVVKLEQSSRVLSIILTGMGYDGAKGMLELKNQGAYTIGQSEESCMVYGMPRAANEIGATRLMASTEEIIDLLSKSLSHLKAG